METMPNAESGPSARRFSLISPSVSLFTVGFWWFSFFLIITFFSQSGSGPVLVTSLPATPRPQQRVHALPGTQVGSSLEIQQKKMCLCLLRAAVLESPCPDPSDVQIPPKPRKVERYCGR